MDFAEFVQRLHGFDGLVSAAESVFSFEKKSFFLCVRHLHGVDGLVCRRARAALQL
jgi:hypothetical protein